MPYDVKSKQYNIKDTVPYDTVFKVKDELIEHITNELERERKRTEFAQARLDN